MCLSLDPGLCWSGNGLSPADLRLRKLYPCLRYPRSWLLSSRDGSSTVGGAVVGADTAFASSSSSSSGESTSDATSDSDSDDEEKLGFLLLGLDRVKGRCPRRKFTLVLVNG